MYIRPPNAQRSDYIYTCIYVPPTPKTGTVSSYHITHTIHISLHPKNLSIVFTFLSQILFYFKFKIIRTLLIFTL